MWNCFEECHTQLESRCDWMRYVLSDYECIEDEDWREEENSPCEEDEDFDSVSWEKHLELKEKYEHMGL